MGKKCELETIGLTEFDNYLVNLAKRYEVALHAEFTVVLWTEESSRKFSVLQIRWIIERAYSWLKSFRRIAMDYEFYSNTGKAMFQLAFCQLMYDKIYD